jgi:hypothetical protein
MADFLWARVRRGLALLGFALAVLAVATEEHRLAWAAIAALVLSLILRLLDRPKEPDDATDA